MVPLSTIEAEVLRLAAIIGASGYVLPTFGHSEDSARPHVESDGRGFHFVIVERGQELRRITTQNMDDLLYHVFEAVTFSLACDFELAHRIQGQDFRRMLFKRQIDLLALLSPAWAERESRDHDRILHEHPFDDLSSARARLAKQYGWGIACDRYPLPLRK
jgi:hypothetical protein